jgi:hypothetical protein
METAQSQPEQQLYDLADKMRQLMQTQRPAKVPEQVNTLMLADFFTYNLTQGGFSQLLFNSGGQYLAEMEDMLLASHARATHDFYIQAIQLCTSDIPRFHAFLESDFTSENELKNQLHLISLAYFKCGVSFVEEAKEYLTETMRSVETWSCHNS